MNRPLTMIASALVALVVHDMSHGAASSIAAAALTPAQRFETAIAYFESSQDSLARPLFHGLTHDVEYSATASYHLAQIDVEAGQLSDATLWLEQAIRNAPTNSLYRASLGVTLQAMAYKIDLFHRADLARRARSQFVQAIALAPDDWEPRFRLLMLDAELFDLASPKPDDWMEGHLSALEALSPSRAAYARGTLYFRARAFDAARVEFATALTLEPECRECHPQYETTLAVLGEYDAVVEHYLGLLESAEPELNWRYRLAYATLLAATRLDEGITQARIYLQHTPQRGDPSLAEAHALLGMLFRAAGRLDEAESELEHALRLDPRLEDAKRMLAEMRGASKAVPR